MKNGPPRRCADCGTNPIAWSNPRVDFCYGCLPGGPFTPPPCRRCGSPENYYSAGLCGFCHLYAPQRRGSCRDCYAWGVERKHKWRCWGCRAWHARFTRGDCGFCGRTVAINDDGACRLCWRQATLVRAHGKALDLAGANRPGQQLFLANLHSTPLRDRGRRRVGDRPRQARPPAATAFRPAQHRQLVLFEADRDLKAGLGGFGEPTDPAMAAFVDQAVRDHAARHGWTPKTVKKTRRGLKILLSLQDTPGAPLQATAVLALQQIDLPARAVMDVCDQVGMLDDDRVPAISMWVEQQIHGLPEAMAAELRTWFRVMHRGSATPPRRRPRSEVTIRVHLRWALPTLRTWAADGHQSLREISRGDVLAALPPSGNPRSTLGHGLRSIFTILKTEKVVFTNPTARISIGAHETRFPLPAKLTAIREALNSPNPACALVTALVAFHGLRTGQLRTMRVTDIRDGRLHLDGRVIPLAGPVRVRLAAYLDERNRRWPNTANPHLFIHRHTAGSTRPFGGRWLGLLLPMPVRVIREDRILHEIHATGGDIRRICDLFGFTVSGAMRYAATLDPPGLHPDHTRQRH